MKSGKRPTRAQKMTLREHSLSPANWLVVKNLGETLEIVHRTSGNIRTISARQGRACLTR